ncbi:hypothetical protein PG984_008185 [Apiospora sp. TS-2023a]
MSVEITQETPANPRDWSGGIDSYLAEHQIACSKVTPLSGGLSGWVWRLDGWSGGSGEDDYPTHQQDKTTSRACRRAGEPAILKCADGMAKLAPVPLEAERLQLEIKALRSPAVAEACRQEPSVEVPRVLQETCRGYLMSFGGEMDLRVAYKEGKIIVSNIPIFDTYQ